MRNQKKSFFAILFSIMVGFAGLLCFTVKPLNIQVANADTSFVPPSEYFSVKKYNKTTSDGQTIYTPVDDLQIQKDHAVFVNPTQVVIFTLGSKILGSPYMIEHYNTTISVDNQTIALPVDQNQSSVYIQKVENTDYDYIEIILNPNEITYPVGQTSPDKEGKYQITITYQERTGFNYETNIPRTFTYSFYLFKTSTYYSNNLPAVSISNVETFSAGSSAPYARTHQFFYNNQTPNPTSLILPNLSFNVNKFEIGITKTVFGITTTSYVKLDSTGQLTQTGENLVKIRKVDDIAYITFNDIGNYQISYVFIHRIDGQANYLANINAITKYDRLNIYGVQAYHTDINSSSSINRKEFKVFENNNSLKVGYQTDVTYALSNTNFNTTNQVVSGVSYVTINHTVTTINLNDKNLVVPSTNQPPVEFNYNVTILPAKSYVLKLHSYNQELSKNLWTVEKDNYTGSAISNPGLYLVKYTFQIPGSSTEYDQWFLFKITNETPNYLVEDESGNVLSSNVFTKKSVKVSAIKNDNPFDSPTQLLVYSKGYSQTEYSNEVVITDERVFTANANYKIVLKFGKQFSKTKTGYFTIDSTEITGLTARNVGTSNNFVRSTAVDFFTNQNVVIEWNEKQASGNKTFGYYKFIPIKQLPSNFTASQLNEYYALGEYIPSNYYLDYSGNSLESIPYTNTANISNLTSQSILREQGMYLVYVCDLAGNEKYYSFVIDKTTPNVLQIMTQTDTIVESFSGLNIVAKPTSIKWGLYKVTHFNFSLDKVNTNTWKSNVDGSELPYDSWLIKILREKATQSQMEQPNCDFKVISNKLHLASRIKNSDVEIMIGERREKISTVNHPGGSRILNSSGIITGYYISLAKINGQVLETTYSFFISDESQTLNQTSTIHSLQVSTDISKTTVRFYDQTTPSNYSGLTQHSYEVVNTTTSTKSLYYMPINYSILQLQYLTKPSPNAIEIDTITVNFYPYISNYLIYKGSSTLVSYLQVGMYYTLNEPITYIGQNINGLESGKSYTLQDLIDKDPNLTYSHFQVGTSLVISKIPEVIEVYNQATGVNRGSLIDGIYIWDINTYYDTSESEAGRLLTKEGKYEIIRTYLNLTYTLEIIGSENDFMVRKTTFIVDRQEIISMPVTVNLQPDPQNTSDYQLISRVGGINYIEVLSGSEDSSNIFTSFYRAKNYSPELQTNILETNKLPVKVAISVQKFGELFNNELLLFKNNYFYADSINSYINSFEIIVTITNLATAKQTKSSYTVEITNYAPESGSGKTFIKIADNLYMQMTGIQNGYINLPELEDIGQYKISISQNNASLKGVKTEHVMFIELKSVAPTFEIEDTKGNPLEQDTNSPYYHTNQKVIRVKWEDPTNPYMAKIDKTDIAYFLNGVKYVVNPLNITSSQDGTSHYFDLNISAVLDEQVVTIQMHYEGSASVYPAGSYMATKNILIDRIAPTQSIEKLIAKAQESSILNSANLRDGHGQPVTFNRTTTNPNSMFKNFAFAVDISDFESLIFQSTDKFEIRYKLVENKYTDASYKELDPESPSALTEIKYTNKYVTLYETNLNELQPNNYYEIAEIDRAGNITVYSIYLTNFEQFVLDQPTEITDNKYKFVQYSSAVSQDLYVTPKEIVNSNFNITIYSKGNFVLNRLNTNNYPWAIITFNNVKYIYSPNYEDGVYKWVSPSQQTETKLSEQINLSLSSYNYLITVRNLPFANVNIQVAVSNQQLSIKQPSGFDETFTITKVQANQNTQVDWKSVTIWEYQNRNVARQIVFVNGILEPIFVEPETEYAMAYYTTNGNVTTFKINARAGSHYRYRIIDNFDYTYTFHHIYGQEFVETIVNLDGLGKIQTDVDESGDMYYLSNKGFNFTFYPSITEVDLTISKFNTTGIGESYTSSHKITGDPSSWNIPYEYAEVVVSQSGSYLTIKLKPFLTPSSTKFIGETVSFTIKAKTNILSSDADESEELTEEETYRFMIYNLLPVINLKGKNRQDMNSLFNESTNMTSEPITIEFSNTQNYLYPVEVYVSYNGGTPQKIQSGDTFSQPGTYVVQRVYTGAMSVFEIPSQKFVISDSNWQFYSVSVYSESEGKYIEVQQTGEPYTTDENGPYKNIKIYSHYIVNSLNYRINLNSSQKMQILTPESNLPAGAKYYYFTDTKNGVDTFVRTISNYYSEGNEYLNYYETTIAITYIPPTNKILGNFYYVDSAGVNQPFPYAEKTYAIDKELDSADTVIVAWSNYHKIYENKISVEIRYGQNNALMSLSGVQTKNNISSIVLSRSGYYTFTFKDMAGNVHKFNQSATVQDSTTSYEFIYLKNVIFNVNNAPAIPYAIYNDDVVISIPSYTLGYYDSNARPKISVLRNGSEYTGYTYNSNTLSYTFKETGLYKVVFSAKRQGKEIREEPLIFQIIRSNEHAWSFDIEQYENYYIKTILKNGVDVTRQLSNSSIGTITYIPTPVTSNGETQIVNLPYLKNLVVSLYDEQTGPGNWTITVATDNDLKQEFTFSFIINSSAPPIEISIGESESTTDPITVKFNAKNLFDEVGDVIVRISTKDDIVLNAEYFANSSNQIIFEITLTRVGDHYIQLYTPSERLIYSYKVTREQPLNSIAIILIVVTSLVVVGLTITFILLRKRMKIR